MWSSGIFVKSCSLSSVKLEFHYSHGRIWVQVGITSLPSSVLAFRGEPTQNFLVMLGTLSLKPSWWFWWMVCPLGPPVEYFHQVMWVASHFLSIPACLITECYCSFLYHLPVQGKHFLISPCEMRRHFLKVSKDYCGREFRPSPGILASVLNLITWEIASTQ